MKTVNYKVKEDDFNNIVVIYTDENDMDHSATCPTSLFGNKAAAVKFLCESLGISTSKPEKEKKTAENKDN